jgi:hypothetical protein
MIHKQMLEPASALSSATSPASARVNVLTARAAVEFERHARIRALAITTALGACGHVLYERIDDYRAFGLPPHIRWKKQRRIERQQP